MVPRNSIKSIAVAGNAHSRMIATIVNLRALLDGGRLFVSGSIPRPVVDFMLTARHRERGPEFLAPSKLEIRIRFVIVHT